MGAFFLTIRKKFLAVSSCFPPTTVVVFFGKAFVLLSAVVPGNTVALRNEPLTRTDFSWKTTRTE